jgi:hypothetical protein
LSCSPHRRGMIHGDPSGAVFFIAPACLHPFSPPHLSAAARILPSPPCSPTDVWFPFCMAPLPAFVPLWRQLALGAATSRPSPLSPWRPVRCLPRSSVCTRSGRGDSPSSGYDDGGQDADFRNQPFPRHYYRKSFPQRFSLELRGGQPGCPPRLFEAGQSGSNCLG